jgi:lactoylglutathione lyase
MKIGHIAIWTKDLERMKHFYEKYFQITAGEKYFNPTKNFESYFLRFEEGARLEIMRKPETAPLEKDLLNEFIGLAHFAVSVGSKEKVNTLTEKLRHDGFQIIGEPRTTGDGYYESIVLDPEGNRIEITI